jgi:hypothetical protein
MPERHDFQKIRLAGHVIVKVIPDAPQMNATDTAESDVCRTGANPWLNRDNRENALELFAYRIGRGWTIQAPPCLGLANVLCS